MFHLLKQSTGNTSKGIWLIKQDSISKYQKRSLQSTIHLPPIHTYLYLHNCCFTKIPHSSASASVQCFANSTVVIKTNIQTFRLYDRRFVYVAFCSKPISNEIFAFLMSCISNCFYTYTLCPLQFQIQI